MKAFKRPSQTSTTPPTHTYIHPCTSDFRTELISQWLLLTGTHLRKRAVAISDTLSCSPQSMLHPQVIYATSFSAGLNGLNGLTKRPKRTKCTLRIILKLHSFFFCFYQRLLHTSYVCLNTMSINGQAFRSYNCSCTQYTLIFFIFAVQSLHKRWFHTQVHVHVNGSVLANLGVAAHCSAGSRSPQRLFYAEPSVHKILVIKSRWSLTTEIIKSTFNCTSFQDICPIWKEQKQWWDELK